LPEGPGIIPEWERKTKNPDFPFFESSGKQPALNQQYHTILYVLLSNPTLQSEVKGGRDEYRL
jgi:hypothetical protein